MQRFSTGGIEGGANTAIHQLSQNEARVLHSLVRWPNLSDQAIHSEIGMKKSTFSSIKARLREHDYYRRYYIPNFPLIGFELLMVMHGHLNRFTTLDERMRVAGETIKAFVEDFYIVSESNKAFNLSISQNYTEYSKNQELFYQIYSENKFLTRQGMQIDAYPFEISRIRAFMDYEALVARLFGFESSEYNEDLLIPTEGVQMIKLSKAERKVLAGLVKYPEESDTLIAEKVGVSRNTVANAKRKFLKNKICFPRVVPNLEKLGLKLLVFTHRKFNARTTMEQREEAVELVRKLISPHFYVSKNLDGFLISAHSSFDEYNKAFDEVMKYYLKQDYIVDEPETYQISIAEMAVLKEFEFLPITLKILGFDENKPLADQ
ncbi:MAG: Lrp/AsnC family transcriptional regulator [Candidatus Heimdallarchaeota archaeon]|nr:Lrp/AsnC family transcriptional regulator [Candidatus Heimdallarchaeota archaeon]